ncbi:MAG: transglycosylase domain-containing protein [Crocinitomicaceae bacterium]
MANKKEIVEFSKKWKRILYVLIWLGALSPVFAITLLIMSQSEDELPSIEVLENPPELLASVVLADDGRTELGRYWTVNRSSVSYKDISPYVIDALISTEDERFHEHAGIDLRAILRAAANMGAAGGASTITQQLAKLLFTLQEREKIAELRAQGKPVPPPPSGKIGRLMSRLDEKAKENIIALRLEERYTKEEIITMYLNQFDYLYNAVGIKNAARVYFNKNASELNKSEAAMLVGMVKNPTLYNPYTYKIRNYRSKIAGWEDKPESEVTPKEIKERRAADSLRAHSRRNQALYQWLKNSDRDNPALSSKITREEYDKIKNENLPTDYQVVDHKEGLAPYFRESLRADLSTLFNEKNEDGSYKLHKADGSKYNVYSDGLKIYTTINADLQQYAEYALKRHLREGLQKKFTKNNRRNRNFPFTNDIDKETVDLLMNSGRKQSERYRKMKAGGISNDRIIKSFNVPTQMKVFSWNGEIDTVMTPNDSIRYYKNLLRAGLISIEPSTGFVKAWVGGTDFKHFAFDHVKLGKRQVGSTIKPFVYATAMLMGKVKPCTKFVEGTSYCVDVFDENGQQAKQWCPEGDIRTKDGSAPTVYWGLRNSNNPVTVAVMSQMGGYSGPKTISKLLKGLDIELRPEDEVPSMCLGIMDLSLFQMVGAQAMFVNQGMYVRPSTVLRIEDRNGNVIYSAEPYVKEVLSSNVAYETLKMMKGVVTAGTAVRLLSSRYEYGGFTMPMAGKTGTTQNNSDGWYFGLTPDLVTGVWVGAEDRAVHFRYTEDGQGARMAMPIFGYYMNKAYANKKLNLSTEDFPEPAGYDPLQFSCDGAATDTPPDIELPF